MGISTKELNSKKRMSGHVELIKPTSNAWDKNSMMMVMKSIHFSNIQTACSLGTCNAFLGLFEMHVI